MGHPQGEKVTRETFCGIEENLVEDGMQIWSYVTTLYVRVEHTFYVTIVTIHEVSWSEAGIPTT
jgi:hypothetical protein